MKLLFLGDSLTAGYADESGLGWAGRLAIKAMRTGRDLTWYNLGIRANTSTDIHNRWKEEVDRRCGDQQPHLVLSMGAADIARGVSIETTQTNALAMLTEMTARGPLLVIGPPPSLREGYAQAVVPLDTMLSGLAKRHGIPYVSSLRLLDGMPTYETSLKTGDGIHPDANGYAVWAEALLARPEVHTFITTQGH